LRELLLIRDKLNIYHWLKKLEKKENNQLKRQNKPLQNKKNKYNTFQLKSIVNCLRKKLKKYTNKSELDLRL